MPDRTGQIKHNFSDQQIMDHILSGRESRDKMVAFLCQDEVLKKNCGYFTYKIKDQSDRKDIFHDSIIQFIFDLEDNKFRRDCSIRTYITSICKYKCLKYFSTLQKQHRNTLKVEAYYQNFPESLIEIPKAEEPTEELSNLFKLIFSQLTKNCQDHLQLKYFEGLLLREMADLLKKKEQSIKNQLKRCKDALRQIIESNEEAIHIINQHLSQYHEQY